MKNYEFSLITPYNNVDFWMFQQCCESVFRQTYGFENMEWIVVIHNSDKEHTDAVFEMLGHFDNVQIAVLNNNFHTASSPRNYGIELAAGEYILFLDADDKLTPQCVEKMLEKALEHKAQVVIARQTYELEDQALNMSSVLTCWNQIDEFVLIDNNQRKSKELFFDIYLMSTGKLFQRDFLKQKGIRFNESIITSEDVLFTALCICEAQRICYLNHVIGYIYYVNNKSMMRNYAKPKEQVMRMIHGVKIVFDELLAYGINIDSIIVMSLAGITQAIVQSPLTMEDRQEIRDILEPYIMMAPQLPTSKIMPVELASYMHNINRDVYLHPESFADGYYRKDFQNGQENLQRILRENKDTDFGRRYSFDELQTTLGYQYKVPLTSYATYKPLIELQTIVGEKEIFVKEDISHYLLTAGGREMPGTKEYLKTFCHVFKEIIGNKKTFLLAESLPMGERFLDGATLNTAIGVMLTEFYMQIHNSFNEISDYFTAPLEVLFPKFSLNTAYIRLLFALADEQTKQIVAPFTWGIYEVFCILERDWESLCDDIEHGTIHFPQDVPEQYRKKLKNKLMADPMRANSLRTIFEKGFDTPVVGKIWPELERIVAGGSGNFQIYAQRLKRYTGDMPLDNGYYICAQGVIGKALQGGNDYEMLTDVNFYEFLPVSDNMEKPVLMADLCVGKDYEIVITNGAGLYRYPMGDLIRIKSAKAGHLVFEPIGQRSDRVAGIGERDVYEAIGIVEGIHGVMTDDFAYCVNKQEKCLTIYLELPEFIPENSAVDQMVLQKDFDKALKSICPAYRLAFERGEVIGCQVLFIQPQTQLLHRDRLRFGNKMAPDHLKPIRLLSTKGEEDFFQAMLAR